VKKVLDFASGLTKHIHEESLQGSGVGGGLSTEKFHFIVLTERLSIWENKIRYTQTCTVMNPITVGRLVQVYF